MDSSDAAAGGGQVLDAGAERSGLGQLLARNARRIVKSLLGLALFAAAVWTFHRNLILTVSNEAVVSTDFVDVAASIEGVVKHNGLTVGAVFAADQPIGTITNRLVDKSRVNELQAKLAALDGEIGALESVVGVLDGLSGTFESRGKAYRERRARQLEILVSQARARLEADQAREAASRTHLTRAESMTQLGLSSGETEEEARRDAAVAEKTRTASERELDNLSAMLEALEHGFTIGDFSAMDKSYSSQRGDDIRLRLAQLRGDLAEKRGARPALASELEAERAQFAALSEARLSIDRRSRVMSVAAANGVFVPRGAPIARLVDCSSLRVLAYVSAYKYNRIAVGDRAAIEVLPGRRRYAGTVAFRLGSSDLLLSVGTAVTIPANQRERFAIVVSSSEMAADLGDRCEIGQNAEVTFYPGTAS